MVTEPDFQVVADRGKGIGAMQPMKIGEGGSRYRNAVDLALELTAKSAAFRSSLPPAMWTGLGVLTAASSRAPLQTAVHSKLAGTWMPGLLLQARSDLR